MEFNTVTGDRKFYKSGESEYRLNDVTCRLKDIQNLFMDTGISTDSYAIIELGMVDDIIKDKDNSRRRMLEQAAGSSTRHAKKRQRAGCHGTGYSPSRICCSRSTTSSKSLENQAKKAEKYYEIKKEYRELSIELAKAALEGFNLSYRELNARAETETDKKIRTRKPRSRRKSLAGTGEAGVHRAGKGPSVRNLEFNDLVQHLQSKENEKNWPASVWEFFSGKKKAAQIPKERRGGK